MGLRRREKQKLLPQAALRNVVSVCAFLDDVASVVAALLLDPSFVIECGD